jgi:alpha-1,3-rhamnosyl/mannosyltransferase
MRIAINIRSFLNRGGIGEYSRSIVKNLVKCFPDDTFLLFGIPGTDTSFLPERDNWRFIEIRGPSNRIFWERFSLTPSVNEEKADIFHCPDYTAPPGMNCPIVVTVHDLSFKFFPRGVSLKARILYNLTAPRSMERSSLLISDSHFTKNEIKNTGWKNPNDIRVVHLGVGDEFLETIPNDEIKTILKIYELEQGYILYLGALDKRKNIALIINAYGQLKKNGLNPPKLVLAGDDIGGGSEITNLILKLGLGNDVRRIGFIPREHIRQIYKGAIFFVFPSIYEGFGLPPLEAMACGVPVIASEAASLPEVVGNAAILIPVADCAPLIEAMRIFLADDLIRGEYASKGQKRARDFTWEKTARETMNVFLEVIDRSRTHKTKK